MKKSIIYSVSGVILAAVIVIVIVAVHHNRKNQSMTQTDQYSQQDQASTQPTQPDTSASTPTTPSTPATTVAAITLPSGYSVPPDCANIDFNNSVAVLNTSLGTIKFQMYASDAPLAVVNFDCLIHRGYYNGLIFHRVIEGFMNQGGDPTGTGAGGTSAYASTPFPDRNGTGFNFADELNSGTASYKAGYQSGVLAMANAGPNTNGSQFFVMASNYPLPNQYTIFGKVISGLDVVTKINGVATDPSTDKPLQPVTITSATLEVPSK